jgi:hypothetical protein
MNVDQRFGRLVAIGAAGKDNRNNLLWSFRCDCGTLYATRATSVRNGYTVSCGCHRSEQSAKTILEYSDPSATRTHGKRDTAEYSTWSHMKQRCNNPKDPKYSDYGARGIKVCKRWEKFENFFSDMGTKPSPDHSIERIDNDGNYSADNCCWAVPSSQARNKRNNIYVSFRGRRMVLKDACREAGINYSTGYMRLQRGWPISRALS